MEVNVPEKYIEEVITCMSQEFYDRSEDWVENSVTFLDWVDRLKHYSPNKTCEIITRCHDLYVISKGEKLKLRRKREREAKMPEPKKPKRDKMGRPRKYPFDDMGIWDSFLITEESYSHKLSSKIGTCLLHYKKSKEGKKKDFMVRKDGDYLRVIRTK